MVVRKSDRPALNEKDSKPNKSPKFGLERASLLDLFSQIDMWNKSNGLGKHSIDDFRLAVFASFKHVDCYVLWATQEEKKD